MSITPAREAFHRMMDQVDSLRQEVDDTWAELDKALETIKRIKQGCEASAAECSRIITQLEIAKQNRKPYEL